MLFWRKVTKKRTKHIEISDAVADDSDYDRDFIEGSVDDDDDEGWMDDGGDVDIE